MNLGTRPTVPGLQAKPASGEEMPPGRPVARAPCDS